MGKFKSDTARHRDPRKQWADPSARPCGRVKQGAGGVASSVIATADVRAVGLFSGADLPRLVGHTPSLPAIMPGRGGRKPQLGSRSSAAMSSPWSREHGKPPCPAPPGPVPDDQRGTHPFTHRQGRGRTRAQGQPSRIRCARIERPPPPLGARRAIGPDHVLAVRADDHLDLTTVLDIEECGVADVPPAGVELVEHVGDLSGRLHFMPARRIPWPTPHASAMMAGARALQVGRTLPCLTNRMTSRSS
jgi:hypothetical protein